MKNTGSLVVLGLALALTGCSSRGSLRPGTVVPTKPAGLRSMTNKVDAYQTTSHTIETSRSGQLVLRLTWPDQAVDLELYLAAGSCPTLYPRSGCPVKATSRSAVGAVEQVTRPVKAGEQYMVFVDNLDPKRGQSYTLIIEVR